MKYYHEKGQKDHPVVHTFARIEFTRMNNSEFQERVFSNRSNATKKNQSRMEFGRLEKRTLLAHNKELIRKKVI